MPCGHPFQHCVVKVYGNCGSWTHIFNITDTKAYSWLWSWTMCVCLCMHVCSRMHVCMYDVYTHTVTKYTGYLVVKCVFIFARGRVWLSLSVLCLFVFCFYFYACFPKMSHIVWGKELNLVRCPLNLHTFILHVVIKLE
jgi:hypothetical protein